MHLLNNSTNCTNVGESQEDELLNKTTVASPGGGTNPYSKIPSLDSSFRRNCIRIIINDFTTK